MIKNLLNIFTIAEVLFITIAILGVLYDYCRDRFCIGSSVSTV
jgi:hypothetical protein